jgi:uncharacterized OB-fold protein
MANATGYYSSDEENIAIYNQAFMESLLFMEDYYNKLNEKRRCPQCEGLLIGEGFCTHCNEFTCKDDEGFKSTDLDADKFKKKETIHEHVSNALSENMTLEELELLEHQYNKKISGKIFTEDGYKKPEQPKKKIFNEGRKMDMGKCPECGGKVSLLSKYCMKCRKKVNVLSESIIEASITKGKCPTCGTTVCSFKNDGTGYCVKCKKKVSFKPLTENYEIISLNESLFNFAPKSDILNEKGRIAHFTNKAVEGVRTGIKKTLNKVDDVAFKGQRAVGTEREDIEKTSREEIVTGRMRPSTLIKHALAPAAVGAGVAGPVGAAITGLLAIGRMKNIKRKERQRMIEELATELPIIDEKIKDASEAGDKKAKYYYMRLRKETARTLDLLKYRATPKSGEPLSGSGE